MEDLEKLKYPLGKYRAPELISQPILNDWILQIAQLPKDLRTLTVNLSEGDLKKTYRPGGWNVKQLIHHIVLFHQDNIIQSFNKAAEDLWSLESKKVINRHINELLPEKENIMNKIIWEDTLNMVMIPFLIHVLKFLLLIILVIKFLFY